MNNNGEIGMQHKSQRIALITGGSRGIGAETALALANHRYAHWRSQADFDAFLKRHGAAFAQFGQNALRIDPHTYNVVYLDEPARS